MGKANGDESSIIVKVKYDTPTESMARNFYLPSKVRLEDLEYKIRERFEITSDLKVELCYIDEDGDRIMITHDDDMLLALSQERKPTFELLVKSKVSEEMCLYPETAKGQPGEAVEVWIAAQYLTVASATREDTKAWGTFVYTDDSDILKALVHADKICLAHVPPPFNVIATIRFLPGCVSYIGSTRNDITTQSYDNYGTSYVIEHVRLVPAMARANKRK
uniref:RXT3-like protein C1259.07 n=1 Tax=Anthurium amnicola TaxID=1678845 RepID=A0A1D1YW51_9ARAE